MLPNPYPIPSFRGETETNLANDILTDSDRKYMVKTLATMLMTYIQRPSLSNCLVVSKALHKKFTFLGDEDSEVMLIRSMNFWALILCKYRILGSGSYTTEPKM